MKKSGAGCPGLQLVSLTSYTCRRPDFRPLGQQHGLVVVLGLNTGVSVTAVELAASADSDNATTPAAARSAVRIYSALIGHFGAEGSRCIGAGSPSS